MNKRKSFVQGFHDSGPICLAFFLLCLSFGALSHAANLSLAQTMFMAIFIYSVPLQIILINIMQHSSTLFDVVLTTLMVNFRFSLMTATLLPYFKRIKTWLIALTVPMLSASAFTVAHVKLSEASEDDLDGFSYYLGIAGIGFVVTIIATLCGFLVKDVANSSFIVNLITMILPIHFTALTAMRWPKYRFVLSTILGGVFMPVAAMFFKQAIVIVPVLIGFVFTVYHKSGEAK